MTSRLGSTWPSIWIPYDPEIDYHQFDKYVNDISNNNKPRSVPFMRIRPSLDIDPQHRVLTHLLDLLEGCRDTNLHRAFEFGMNQLKIYGTENIELINFILLDVRRLIKEIEESNQQK